MYHVNRSHSISIKDYYNTFFIKENENLCNMGCGNPTSFVSFKDGYKDYCNHCSRSLGAKKFRKSLKEDHIKFKTFTNKVSENQEKIWAQRESDGTKDRIIQKATTKNKLNLALLSDEERRDKFGWIHKLEDEEKDIATRRITKPLHNWWGDTSNESLHLATIKKRQRTMKNKPLEEKNEITKKKLSTRYKTTRDAFDMWIEEKGNKALYYKAVWEITELSYNFNKK